MNKTPYAVICVHCGQQFLSEKVYMTQLMRPNSSWRCPICNDEAEWDDDNYDEMMEE